MYVYACNSYLNGACDASTPTFFCLFLLLYHPLAQLFSFSSTIHSLISFPSPLKSTRPTLFLFLHHPLAQLFSSSFITHLPISFPSLLPPTRPTLFLFLHYPFTYLFFFSSITHSPNYIHRHMHTHTQKSLWHAQTHTNTHIRFVNYPVANETSTRPRKVCPSPRTGSRGRATPWKIALLHDTISPGFAIPSYVRCSWEAGTRKERN